MDKPDRTTLPPPRLSPDGKLRPRARTPLIPHQFGWLLPKRGVHASLRPLGGQRAGRSTTRCVGPRRISCRQGLRGRKRTGSRAWRWALQDSNGDRVGRTLQKIREVRHLAWLAHPSKPVLLGRSDPGVTPPPTVSWRGFPALEWSRSGLPEASHRATDNCCANTGINSSILRR